MIVGLVYDIIYELINALFGWIVDINRCPSLLVYIHLLKLLQTKY